MTQQLDSRVRAAFDQVVSHAPSIGETPDDTIVNLVSGNRNRGPQIWVAAAAASAVVLGVGALMAITPNTSQSSIRPAISPSSVTERRLDTLIAPIDGDPSLVSVLDVGSSWVARASTFVAPDSRVLSTMLLAIRDGGFPGEQRSVAGTTFTFVDEDGRHTYVAMGKCQAVSVVVSNEHESEPWSAEAMALMTQVDVDNSGQPWVAPEGWTEIPGGFSEVVYDYPLTIPDAAGRRAIKGLLSQSDAPLGHLLALSEQAFSSARPITVDGLPFALDGDRAWLLTGTSDRSLWYLGWNTSAGSALLSIELESDEPNSAAFWSEIVGRSLRTGQTDFWMSALAQYDSARGANAEAAAAESGQPLQSVTPTAAPSSEKSASGQDRCGPSASPSR